MSTCWIGVQYLNKCQLPKRKSCFLQYHNLFCKFEMPTKFSNANIFLIKINVESMAIVLSISSQLASSWKLSREVFWRSFHWNLSMIKFVNGFDQKKYNLKYNDFRYWSSNRVCPTSFQIKKDLNIDVSYKNTISYYKSCHQSNICVFTQWWPVCLSERINVAFRGVVRGFMNNSQSIGDLSVRGAGNNLNAIWTYVHGLCSWLNIYQIGKWDRTGRKRTIKKCTKKNQEW